MMNVAELEGGATTCQSGTPYISRSVSKEVLEWEMEYFGYYEEEGCCCTTGAKGNVLSPGVSLGHFLLLPSQEVSMNGQF